MGVLLGILITYVAAPLAAYVLIAPAYQERDDNALHTLAIASSFGPIGISLLMFLLLTVAPSQSDLFYAACISLPILLVLFLRYRVLKSLTIAPFLKSLLGSLPTVQNLHNIYAAAARIGLLLLSLILFIKLASQLRELRLSYLLVFASLVLFALVLAVVVRDVANILAAGLEIRRSGSAIKPSAQEIIWRPFERLAGQYLVIMFGGVLVIIMLVLAFRAGLVVPLTENDPIEYAMVSRAIYGAKSLTIYPILTGLPDSGLYAASAHPPAFHLLEAWGYIFDGDRATRLLRLSPLFYLANIIFLMWTLLIRYSKNVAILGCVFALSIPFFIYLAAISHIDPMRIYFFFLSLALVGDIIKHPSWARVVVCGLAFGFALYSHSLGVIAVFIAGLAYLALAGNSLRDRLVNSVIVGVVGSLIGGWQYVKNLVQFGVPLMDYQPVWLLPHLHEEADVAHRRLIGTPLHVLLNGILQNFTWFQVFGPVFVIGTALILYRIRALWRDDFCRVMLFAVAAFYVVVIGVTMSGSLAAIKNPRYMMLIAPAFCYLAAVAFADVSRRWSMTGGTVEELNGGSPGGWWWSARRVGRYFRTQGAVLVVLLLITDSAVTLLLNRLHFSRPLMVLQARETDFGQDRAYWYAPLMHYFSGLSRDGGKAFVFRQADFSFYANHPWIDHLDPALLEFYAIKDKEAAYRDLLRRGISYLFVPNAESIPTSYYNSQAIEIASDPNLAEIVAIARGNSAVFRLRQDPQSIDCARVEPGTVALERPLGARFLAHRLSSMFSVGAETPVLRVELKASDFNHANFGSAFDRVDASLFEFQRFDVSSDAASEQSNRSERRIRLSVDMMGEGIAEIFLRHGVVDAPDPVMLWSGLVFDQQRTVRVQTVLPPGARQLNFFVRKHSPSAGWLDVRKLEVCAFQGPPVQTPSTQG